MCDELLHKSVSCEDIKAALALPILVQQKEYSEGLEFYIDLKRQQHEDITEAMHDEMEKVNENVDSDAAEYIKVCREELEWIKSQTDKSNMDQIFTVEQWVSSADLNKKRNFQIMKVIEDLSNDVKSLEKSRAEAIKNILSKYKEKVLALRFVSVDEIERIFIDEIAEINLKIINNFRKYEDVNLQLEVEGQNIYKEREIALKILSKQIAEKHAQYLWKKIKEREHKQQLTRAVYNLTQENFRAREDLMEVSSNLIKGLSDLANRLELPTEYDIQGEYWGNWTETLISKLESLDELCKSVGKLIKTAITTLTEEVVEQYDQVARNTSGDFHRIEELQGSRSSFSTEVINLKTTQSKELQDLQVGWQITIESLVSKIERARIFISDLTSIWTCHIERVNELHREVGKTLELSYNAALKVYNDKNSKLKGQIKSAREAKDVANLEILCKNIQERFIDLVKEWEDNYEEQLEKIDSIKRKNVERLIGKQLAQMLDFLNVKYPKREWFSDLRYDPSHSSLSLTDSESEVDSQINLCNIYMNAVENRALGMYEMIERFVPYCETSIREETDEWVLMFIQEVINKYDAKLNEINESQKEVLRSLENVRFAELQMHSDRLASHISGVKRELVELNRRYEEVKSKENSALSEFSKKVVALTESKNDRTKGLGHSFSGLVDEWNSFTEKLRIQIFENKNICENKTTYLKNANNLFMKTAKSFKNGGNYSPEELKILNKELKQLEKTVVNNKKTLFKNYEQLSKNIARQVLDLKLEKLHENLKDESLQKVVNDSLIVVRMRLRAEVINMKKRGKALEQKFAGLNSLAKTDDSFMSDLILMINQMHDFMVFPRGVQSLECTEAEQNSVASIVTNVKTQKRNKTSSNNTQESLFKHTTNEFTSDEDNFLAKTKGLILKKFAFLVESVQKIVTGNENAAAVKKEAKKSKKMKEPNLGLKADTSKEQIKEIKSALRSYNSECELAWLGQANEFLNQILNFRKLFNDGTGKELDINHKKHMARLETLEKNHLHSVHETNLKDESIREKLLKSFVLPLAHPNHSQKLKEFQNEAISLIKLQKLDHSNYVIKYKSDLQDEHDQYIEELKILKEKLDYALSLLFNKELCRMLFENSKGINNVFPYEPQVHQKDEKKEEIGLADYALSIWSDETRQNQELNKPSSIFLVLLSSSSKSTLSTPSETSDDVVRMPIKRMAAENAKASAFQIQRLYNQAISGRKTYSEKAETWLKTMELKIKEAQDVFTSICK